VGETQIGSAQCCTDEKGRYKKQQQKKEGIMKKPWAISIVLLIFFLVCSVAGATDKKISNPHKTSIYGKKILKADTRAMNYSNRLNQDNDTSRNGMSQRIKGNDKNAMDQGHNRARNSHQRGSHDASNGAMGKGHTRGRSHDHKIAYNDPHYGKPHGNKGPKNMVHFNRHDRGRQNFSWNPRSRHKIVKRRRGHRNPYAHHDHHGHHHEPGYCTPNFEIFCQRKCGDVSPTSCGGHKGFGKHCNLRILKKCIECGFISTP
jgi:hypothetical protein